VKVRFLMIAEMELADSAGDAEKSLDLFCEAAAKALGTGVCLHRASDDDLLVFPIWEIPDDEGWRSLVPPVIAEGGDPE
jgi:hypothetical protein